MPKKIKEIIESGPKETGPKAYRGLQELKGSKAPVITRYYIFYPEGADEETALLKYEVKQAGSMKGGDARFFFEIILLKKFEKNDKNYTGISVSFTIEKTNKKGAKSNLKTKIGRADSADVEPDIIFVKDGENRYKFRSEETGFKREAKFCLDYKITLLTGDKFLVSDKNIKGDLKCELTKESFLKSPQIAI